MLRILAFQGLDKHSQKRLRRLLKRHGDRVKAVAVVLELDQPAQLRGLVAAYNARALRIPPELLVSSEG